MFIIVSNTLSDVVNFGLPTFVMFCIKTYILTRHIDYEISTRQNNNDDKST